MGSTEMTATELHAEVVQETALETVPMPTSASLVQLAIERGADPAVLEKLMDLHERWEAREARKAYSTAIAAAKSELCAIFSRDKRVHYSGTTKDGKKYTVDYSHVTHAQILERVVPMLSSHGLSMRYIPSQEKNQMTILCEISHTMGYSESVPMTGPYLTSGGKNALQQIGETATYLERYATIAALGLGSKDKDDTDGLASSPPPAPPRSDPASHPAAKSTPRSQLKADAPIDKNVKTISAFAAYGVTQANLETYLSTPLKYWGDSEIEVLRGVYGKLAAAVPEARRAMIETKFGIAPEVLE